MKFLTGYQIKNKIEKFSTEGTLLIINQSNISTLILNDMNNATTIQIGETSSDSIDIKNLQTILNLLQSTKKDFIINIQFSYEIINVILPYANKITFKSDVIITDDTIDYTKQNIILSVLNITDSNINLNKCIISLTYKDLLNVQDDFNTFINFINNSQYISTNCKLSIILKNGYMRTYYMDYNKSDKTISFIPEKIMGSTYLYEEGSLNIIDILLKLTTFLPNYIFNLKNVDIYVNHSKNVTILVQKIFTITNIEIENLSIINSHTSVYIYIKNKTEKIEVSNYSKSYNNFMKFIRIDDYMPLNQLKLFVDNNYSVALQDCIININSRNISNSDLVQYIIKPSMKLTNITIIHDNYLSLRKQLIKIDSKKENELTITQSYDIALLGELSKLSDYKITLNDCTFNHITLTPDTIENIYQFMINKNNKINYVNKIDKSLIRTINSFSLYQNKNIPSTLLSSTPRFILDPTIDYMTDISTIINKDIDIIFIKPSQPNNKINLLIHEPFILTQYTEKYFSTEFIKYYIDNVYIETIILQDLNKEHVDRYIDTINNSNIKKVIFNQVVKIDEIRLSNISQVEYNDTISDAQIKYDLVNSGITDTTIIKNIQDFNKFIISLKKIFTIVISIISSIIIIMAGLWLYFLPHDIVSIISLIFTIFILIIITLSSFIIKIGKEAPTYDIYSPSWGKIKLVVNKIISFNKLHITIIILGVMCAIIIILPISILLGSDTNDIPNLEYLALFILLGLALIAPIVIASDKTYLHTA